MASEGCLWWGHPPNVPSAQHGEFPLRGWDDIFQAEALDFFLKSADHGAATPHEWSRCCGGALLRCDGVQIDPFLGPYRCRIWWVLHCRGSCHMGALQPNLSSCVLHLTSAASAPCSINSLLYFFATCTLRLFSGGWEMLRKSLLGASLSWCAVKLALYICLI